jgi:excisionase family DNA binding protein
MLIDELPKPLIPVSEVARRLNVNQQFVYREARERKIAHVKIGQKVMFSEEAFEEYLDARTHQAVSA